MTEKIFTIPVSFKVKDAQEDADFIEIQGYANTTTKDRQGDVILEEAWTKGGLKNYLKNPIILAYHKHDKPIGLMLDYSVNKKGLKIEAKIFKAAGEIYSLIQSEVLRTFSVGFRTKDADYDAKTDIFVIKDLELMEISVVSVPANADSTFSVRKSFEKDDEYNSFKSSFIDAATVITDNADDNSDNDEEQKMDPKSEAELRAKIRKELEAEEAAKVALKEAIAVQVKAEFDDGQTHNDTVITERVELLQTEITKRFEEEGVTIAEAIEGLKTEMKEYGEKLEALAKSKMSFKDKKRADTTEDGLTDEEKDSAVLVAKIVNLPIEDTKYGKGLIEKSNLQHHGDLTEDWEATFSMRLWDDIREKLIIENLFRSLAMPSVTLHLPLNPEAGYGTWVTNAQLNAATSSGTARIHAPSDTSITAHKLATKELLGYEEEDDSLIALVPLIRDAAVRRMAKSSDKSLLVGNDGASAGTGEGLYPFNGLATIGTDDSRTTTIGGTLASPTAVTVANLATMRRSLGVFGHSPTDLVYVVNHTVYFDLLDDPDFRTMDLVGTKATIITGQVGSVNGSPVVVSGEFLTAAASNAAGICVNMSNYILGRYKSLRVERERSVENQTNLLVVTRRFGMLELFTDNATVATLINPAS